MVSLHSLSHFFGLSGGANPVSSFFFFQYSSNMSSRSMILSAVTSCSGKVLDTSSIRFSVINILLCICVWMSLLFLKKSITNLTSLTLLVFSLGTPSSSRMSFRHFSMSSKHLWALSSLFCSMKAFA